MVGVRGGMRSRGIRNVDMLNRSMKTLYLRGDKSKMISSSPTYLSDKVDLRY